MIAEMIRKSENRDAACLESRWAVRPLDVLQAINLTWMPGRNAAQIKNRRGALRQVTA